jgi:hypothetical protein
MDKPRVNKTKEQILQEMKSNADFQKKIKFTREEFFPALLKANPTIEEASMWLGGFNTAIMNSLLETMKTTKMKDLNLSLKLDAMSDNFIQFRDIITLFDDMTVFDAKDNIEGLKGEIEIWKQDESRERKLSDLKTKWIDEL